MNQNITIEGLRAVITVFNDGDRWRSQQDIVFAADIDRYVANVKERNGRLIQSISTAEFYVDITDGVRRLRHTNHFRVY